MCHITTPIPLDPMIPPWDVDITVPFCRLPFQPTKDIFFRLRNDGVPGCKSQLFLQFGSCFGRLILRNPKDCGDLGSTSHKVNRCEMKDLDVLHKYQKSLGIMQMCIIFPLMAKKLPSRPEMVYGRTCETFNFVRDCSIYKR